MSGRRNGGTADGAPLPPFRRSAVPPSPLKALPVEFVGSFPDPLVRLEPGLPEVALTDGDREAILSVLVDSPGPAGELRTALADDRMRRAESN